MGETFLIHKSEQHILAHLYVPFQVTCIVILQMLLHSTIAEDSSVTYITLSLHFILYIQPTQSTSSILISVLLKSRRLD